ncbi:MAG: hypothetical protein WDA28_13120 [Castellaniella sp.]
MKIPAIFTISINVRDTISIYSNHKEKLIGILTDRYVGKCFRGAFIESIDDLPRISPCYIDQDGDPTHGTITVEMKVTATVFEPGEVLVGCKVVSKTAQIIGCTHPHAAILMNAHELLNSLEPNKHFISVKVVNARYDIARAVSVSAVPYIPQTSDIVYSIRPVKDVEALANYLGQELRRADELEAAMEAADPVAKKFFTDLLLPAGVPATVPKGDNKFINIRDLIAAPRQINVTRGGCPSFSPVVLEAADQKSNALLPTSDVLLLMLRDYCNQLQIIIDHVRVYNTPKMLEEHTNVWRMISRVKTMSAQK